MRTRWQKIVVGLAEIGDGVITVLTLGSCRLHSAFLWTAHFERKRLKGMK